MLNQDIPEFIFILVKIITHPLLAEKVCHKNKCLKKWLDSHFNQVFKNKLDQVGSEKYYEELNFDPVFHNSYINLTINKLR